MAERRRYPRIRRRFLVEFETGKRRATGYTENLSPSGMFVCANHFPKPDTNVALTLKIPRGGRIALRGRVVRSYRVPARLTRFVPSGFCVRIKDAPEEYFQLLAKLFRAAAA